MAEVVTAVKREIGFNLEVPKNRTLVTLPPIEVGPVYRRDGVELRLGMHTDSVAAFASANPQAKNLVGFFTSYSLLSLKPLLKPNFEDKKKIQFENKLNPLPSSKNPYGNEKIIIQK